MLPSYHPYQLDAPSCPNTPRTLLHIYSYTYTLDPPSHILRDPPMTMFHHSSSTHLPSRLYTQDRFPRERVSMPVPILLAITDFTRRQVC